MHWPPEPASSLSARIQEQVATPRLLVRMPPDFVAFCLLNATHYLHYTEVRLKDPRTSRAVVERTLGDLATTWPTALRSPAPAAFGWRFLSLRISGVRRRGPAAAGHAQDGLHQLLQPTEADAVICHRLMELSVPQTAALLGVAPQTVVQRLAAAADSLGTELAHLFGLRAAS